MIFEKTPATGLWMVAGIAVVFGAMTLISGGQALFGGSAAQATPCPSSCGSTSCQASPMCWPGSGSP